MFFTWIWIIEEEYAYCIFIWIEGVIKAVLLEEWHDLMVLECLQKGNVCISQALSDELNTKKINDTNLKYINEYFTLIEKRRVLVFSLTFETNWRIIVHIFSFIYLKTIIK